MQLPGNIEPDEFDQSFRVKPELWKEAITEIAAIHDLPQDGFHFFENGSNLVASVGATSIVKVFPPFHQNQWESEHRVLGYLQQKISLPIPELLAYGKRQDGWYYVIQSILPGDSMEATWSNTPQADREDLLRHIGRTIAEVQAVAVGPLADLPPDWATFIAMQLKGCVARHSRLGAPTWLVEEIPAFLQLNYPSIPSAFTPVILTGEYTPFNLLTETTAQGTRLAGMIDFGDAMIGFPHYDLLGPALFLCEGNRESLKALLEGYGLDASLLDAGLREQLVTLMLLHRYSNLNVQIRIPGWQGSATSLRELGLLIFPS